MRCRASSTDQRARPTPATASRCDGALAIRQRVQAAEGSPSGSCVAAPPAAQEQYGNVGFSRDKLQAPRGDHRNLCRLGHHRCRRTIPDRVLDDRQKRGVVLGLGVDHVRRGQARLAPSRGRRDRSGSLPKAPGHACSALLARRCRQGTAWQPHRRPANRSVRRPRAALQPGALPRSADCRGHSTPNGRTR